ncbi:MAG: ferredoxin reductase family protein [Pseudonocardia sp.]
MRHQLARGVWSAALGAALLAPVLLRLGSDEPGSLWVELSVLTGLLALSALVCTAVLPSRLRSLTSAFGIDGVLGVHRCLGVVVAILVLAHIAFVVASNPANVALLDTDAPASGRAGTAATLALGGLVALAVLRHRLRHRYEVWRWLHVALAGAVLVLSGLHVFWLNHLIQDLGMRTLFVLLAALALGVLAYRWAWRPAFGRGSEYLVREVRPENDTVSTVVLQARGGRHAVDSPSLEFAPGQFAWLRLDRSLAAQEHPFTMASGAHAGHSPEFTIRHSGDFTSTLRRLRPGSPVWLDGPHGSFTVDFRAATGLVMIAGGVGITPMMSMLRTLAHRGDRRPHRLIVVAGMVEELLFRAELAQLRRQLDLTVVEVLRRPRPGWSGFVGEVDALLLAAVLPGPFRRNQLDYFVCGPPALVDSVLAELTELAIPAPRVHCEQFDLV